MEGLLYEFVVIFALSGVVIFVCNKIKVPSIVGFLLTGALFGPSALGLVKEMEAVRIMADVGVVFLLFSIGMELSISELVRLKKPVFAGGSAQVVGTILAFTGLAVWAGLPLNSAVFIGFLFSLSSTAIVLKVMQQRAEVETPGGRISLAVLIYQDLVIVPMMLAVPLLAGTAEAGALAILETFARTIGVGALLFMLTRKVVPWLLALVVSTGSRELFLITILGICLGTAYATSLLGLSLTLGAFMAGLVVSESEYSYSALAGVAPFQSVLTSLFFVSVGMLLNMSFFWTNISDVLLLTSIIVAVKFVFLGVAVLLLRYPLRPAIIVGATLAQVGEFAFVLAKAGLDVHLLSEEVYQYFLAVSILTMAGTPFLMAFGPRIADALDSWRSDGKAPKPKEEQRELEELTGHILIIGYGPAGQLCAWAAARAKLPYAVVEMNPDTVRAYRKAGEPIHYGDAKQITLLEHYGISRASVLVVAISDPAAVYSITQTARHANRRLHIISRARFMAEVEDLEKEGASEVVAEEFEASVELFTRLLAASGVAGSDIAGLVRLVREKKYQALRETVINEACVGMLEAQLPMLTMTQLVVAGGSALAGKSLREAGLNNAAGITVVVLKRGDEIIRHPGENFRFAAGDEVYSFLSHESADLLRSFFEAPKGTV